MAQIIVFPDVIQEKCLENDISVVLSDNFEI